ncbi:U-box domain-containing protein [Zostera marina]|uniref:U-box domain-containing protein n=1 Tax=Zostera marina TaxID=29655 RepID=A0A0K9PXL8_ZOSMR|nr:U-box domain-containing protein [Zostera marina]
MLGEKMEEAKEAGLLAILNIATRNERNKIILLQFGVLSSIVELLQSQSTRLRELATAGILTLSSPDSNKPLILASGAPSLLVEVIISGNIQGQVDAVTAMYNLSTCQQGFDARICLKSAFHLLALLKDCKKLSKFAEKATTLLDLLSTSQEGRDAITESEGSILTLVETVEDGSPLAAEYATSILLNICKSCRDKYRELILNEGPIPSLLLLTVHGTDRAQGLAHTLLQLLRDNSKQNRVSTEELQCMVYKIVSHVDGPEKALETAGNILKDVTGRDPVVGIVEMN